MERWRFRQSKAALRKHRDSRFECQCLECLEARYVLVEWERTWKAKSFPSKLIVILFGDAA